MRPATFAVVSSFLMLAMLVGGCAEADYKGMQPSVRQMNGGARMQDCYVGMNARWALDQPSSYRFEAPPTAASTGAVSSVDGN